MSITTNRSIELLTNSYSVATRPLVSVVRACSSHLVTGYLYDDKLKTEKLGYVSAQDPNTRDFISLRLVLEMTRKLSNYYIRSNHDWYQKYEGLVPLKYSQLRALCERVLTSSCAAEELGVLSVAGTG